MRAYHSKLWTRIIYNPTLTVIDVPRHIDKPLIEPTLGPWYMDEMPIDPIVNPWYSNGVFTQPIDDPWYPDRMYIQPGVNPYGLLTQPIEESWYNGGLSTQTINYDDGFSIEPMVNSFYTDYSLTESIVETNAPSLIGFSQLKEPELPSCQSTAIKWWADDNDIPVSCRVDEDRIDRVSWSMRRPSDHLGESRRRPGQPSLSQHVSERAFAYSSDFEF